MWRDTILTHPSPTESEIAQQTVNPCPQMRGMGQGADAFVHALSRTACAQIIVSQAERMEKLLVSSSASNSQPFSGSQLVITESAIDAFSDLIASFIQDLGRQGASLAQLSGRNRPNVTDVLSVLQDARHGLRGSLTELAKYASSDHASFPHSVPDDPSEPILKKRKRPNDLAANRKKVRTPSVESWMPPLPSAHTYIHTPVFVDVKHVKKGGTELRMQRTRIADILAKLHEQRTENESNAEPKEDFDPFACIPSLNETRSFRKSSSEVMELLTKDDRDDQFHDSGPKQVTLMDVPKGAAFEQKRQRVERILAETGI